MLLEYKDANYWCLQSDIDMQYRDLLIAAVDPESVQSGADIRDRRVANISFGHLETAQMLTMRGTCRWGTILQRIAEGMDVLSSDSLYCNDFLMKLIVDNSEDDLSDHLYTLFDQVCINERPFYFLFSRRHVIHVGSLAGLLHN